MSSSPVPPRKRSVFALVAVLLLVLVGLGAYAAYTYTATDNTDFTQLMADYARRFGPRARLDEKLYSDKDGNLQADPPTDPAKLRDPEKIVFTALTFDDPEKVKAVWKPFLDHLSKTVGKPVEYDAALRSPEGQLAALRDGKLHVTAFSTGLVPAAVNSAGFVPAFVPADEKGNYTYQMEIIVPADSPIKSAADLKGRQMTFSGMSSNAGMKAPIYLLWANFGLRVGKDYGFNISGGYRASLKGIAAKRYEAVAVANDLLKREVALGTIREDQFRSVFKSEDFPPLCFGHAHDLRPELVAKVRQAFLSFPWKGTSVEKEFAASGLSKFVEVDYKTGWAFVRTVDEGMLRFGDKPSR